jgi:dihydroorotase
MEKVIEGKAYLEGKFVKCCIGIEDGKIASIKKILKGEEHHDFGDKLILPAGTDIHVHFRDPGLTHKENFESGSMSAAFGGITCILDMPNTKPFTASVANLKEKISIAQRKSYVDFGLYAGLNSDSDVNELAKLCSAFKIFLAEDYETISDAQLKSSLEEIKKYNKVTAFHCEEFIRKGGSSLLEHLSFRPNECEINAIQHVKGFNAYKMHICHVSAKESIPLLTDKNITSEVTPHHLLLNMEKALGAFGKVNPPLRRKDDQRALWNALNNGIIDIIASDHAPHTIEEKEEEFKNAPSGVPGVETMFPLMLMMMKKGMISLNRLINAVCERPAERFDINKGKIKEGYDGDLIVIDLRNISKIKGDKLHSKCAWSPFDNFDALFPTAVFLRGNLLIENGELAGERLGKYITSDTRGML